MNRLLLISCSQRKVETDKALPALELYDGPVYRSLRKMQREDTLPKNLDILIISALHGLVHAKDTIRTYDLKMTAARADQPEFRLYIHNCLKGYQQAAKYEQVFVNLGKIYARTLENYHWGLISYLEASGGIGQRVSQMRVWLERGT